MSAPDDLPDIGALVVPLLADVPAEHRPYVVAYLERVAAGRYRLWAGEVADVSQRRRLLACAEREEEIASRVEGLSAEAASVQQAFVRAHPEIGDLYASLFSGRPLADQLRIQARGERLGAATWRAFAGAASDEVAAAVLSDCAPLEEESAAVLEALITEGV